MCSCLSPLRSAFPISCATLQIQSINKGHRTEVVSEIYPPQRLFQFDDIIMAFDDVLSK